jgi:hypothetical protein
MNKGELDEYMCILKLIEIRQNGGTLFSDKIISLKSNGIELNDLPNDLELNHHLLEDEVVNIANHCNFKKSPSNSKADIHINDIGYSIKSVRSSPPAIVNHTARPGFVNVCERIGVDISQLDSMIDEYWIKRKKRILKEDVRNDNNDSPFTNHSLYLKPILNYFLFVGTGQKDSLYPSSGIILFDNPLDPEKWLLKNKEDALDFFWRKLVFSLRSKKGMPSGYPYKMSKKALINKSSVEKWTEFIDGDYRGALHIRIGR